FLCIPVAQGAKVMAAVLIQYVQKYGYLMFAKWMFFMVAGTGRIEIPFFVLFQNNIIYGSVNVFYRSFYGVIFCFLYRNAFRFNTFFCVGKKGGRRKQFQEMHRNLTHTHGGML